MAYATRLLRSILGRNAFLEREDLKNHVPEFLAKTTYRTCTLEDRVHTKVPECDQTSEPDQ